MTLLRNKSLRNSENPIPKTHRDLVWWPLPAPFLRPRLLAVLPLLTMRHLLLSRLLRRPSSPSYHHLLRPLSSSSPLPASDSDFRKYAGYALLILGCGAATYYSFPLPSDALHKKAVPFKYAPLPDDLHAVSNWSATHEVHTRVLLQPDSLLALQDALATAHKERRKLRPLGSGLSPNGLALSRAGMVNLALMDKVLDVDVKKKTVTVQAGIRVAELVDALREHGLTLQNFASIREQQVGGIIQVGAHGTGARLPPIDEQVISMKLVTPAKGTIDLSREKDPDLFYLARCGLGGLGVVAEVTLQCVERHQLVEHTFVSNADEVRKNHKKWLSENKHIKYLWIPYTDTVVVVQCNPPSRWKTPKLTSKYGKDEAVQHVRDLYRESLKKYSNFSSFPQCHSPSSAGCSRDSPPEGPGPGGGRISLGFESPAERAETEEIFFRTEAESNDPEIDQLSFTELRDRLLALDPLDKYHVVRINKAEAEYWKKSEGYRLGWSDEILGFDCGGQQWVSETCFPAGTLANPSMKDLDYIEELLQLIEKEDIPAPAPIEQRWTARSKSPMSPASSSEEDDIFSWVGIIMYLPTSDARQRKEITEEFFSYRSLTQTSLWDDYSAYEHWAKIEVPKDKDELAEHQARLRKRFPVDAYNKARMELDPNKVLSNAKLEKLFPVRGTVQHAK